MCTKSRTRPELQPHDICHHNLIKILYTCGLNKKVEQLRKLRERNLRQPAPRRSRRGQTKVSTQTLAQETKGESSHVPIEKHDETHVKEPEVKFYERRTRSQQKLMVGEKEAKLRATQSKKGKEKVKNRGWRS